MNNQSANSTATNQTSQTMARPIRVGVVCAIDLSVKMLFRKQILAMQEKGYDICAICSDGPYVQELREQGITMHTVPIARRIKPLADVMAIFKLIRLFRKLKLDIVHTNTPKAAFLAQIAAKLAGIPIRVNTVHGFYYYAIAPGLKQTLFKKLELWACNMATFNFGVSREDVDLVEREKLVPINRFKWLGNGVDLSRFDPHASELDESPTPFEEFDIPRDAFVIGIVARMVSEKGFRELFEAFAKVREKTDKAYLLHVGFIDTSRQDEVTPELADQFGIRPYCRFAGQRDDLPRLINAMDVFCLPSYREGYPISVMEANAMGVPAIVTDIRGCREAVIHEFNGLIIPVREVEPLAQAILRLYEDETLRKKLEQGAVERAKDEFDERDAIDRIAGAYEKLVMQYLPNELIGSRESIEDQST